MKTCRKCHKKTNIDTDFICAYCGGPLKSQKSNPLTERRYGQIQIPLGGLEDEYEGLMELIQDMFVTKCDFMYGHNIFVVIGVHPDFEPCEEGVPPNRYNIMYNNDDYTFSFEKVVMSNGKPTE